MPPLSNGSGPLRRASATQALTVRKGKTRNKQPAIKAANTLVTDMFALDAMIPERVQLAKADPT